MLKHSYRASLPTYTFMEQAVQSSLEVNKSTTTNTLLICFLLCYNNMTLQLILHFSTSQPNARKEDLFGRPSQGLYSSSYTASKGLAEATLDRSCLEVNMGSSQVYKTTCPPCSNTLIMHPSFIPHPFNQHASFPHPPPSLLS